MSQIKIRLLAAAFVAGLAMQPLALSAAEPVGAFEDHGDVGINPRKGSVEFDPAVPTYKITGGGANMWADIDAFHFVWKKISGDVAITADVELLGKGVVPHRKAGVIVRQSLDANSAYADAILHGDGLTSLQYRAAAGEQTKQIESPLKGLRRLRIERRGNQFIMYAGDPDGELTASGPVTVTLSDPVYVGLAVCSHDANVLETAVFTDVRVETPPRPMVGGAEQGR
jgi:hypothetical protein